MIIQEHYLEVFYYYKIKIIVVISPDIKLFCCVKDIDLYIDRNDHHVVEEYL